MPFLPNRWRTITALAAILLLTRQVPASVLTECAQSLPPGETASSRFLLISPHFSEATLATGMGVPVDLVRDPVERERYRVTFGEDGVALQGGIPLPDGEYMWVMGPQGGFYAYPERKTQYGPFHHATFFANAPVAGSGMWAIAGGRGRIVRISNVSGCYPGDATYLKQAIAEMPLAARPDNLEILCRLETGEFRLDYPPPTEDHVMPWGTFRTWQPPARIFFNPFSG